MASSNAKPALKTHDQRRRRHARHRSDFRVTVSRFLGNEYQQLEGHCRDLSEAGIGIILSAELNPGDVVGLNFSLSESAVPWDVRAVIRYRRGCQYGFEFLSLTGEQRGLLEGYLKGREPID